jgi:hypothetical protein
MPPQDPNTPAPERNKKRPAFSGEDFSLLPFSLRGARQQRYTTPVDLILLHCGFFVDQRNFLIIKRGFSGIWVQAFFVCVNSLLDYVEEFMNPRFMVLWMGFL